MWKDILEFSKQIIGLTRKTQQHEEDIKTLRQERKDIHEEMKEREQETKELREELRDLTMVVQRLAFEMQRSHDSAAHERQRDRDNAAHERDNLILRLENTLLKLEKRHLAGSPDTDETK